MPGWLAEFASVKWLVSVVMVGVLLNLVSRRVDEYLVKRGARFSHWWTKNAMVRRNGRLNRVRRLRTDDIYRAAQIVELIRCLFVCSMSVAGAFLALFSQFLGKAGLLGFNPSAWVSAAFIVVCMFTFMLTYVMSMRVASEFYDAAFREG